MQSSWRSASRPFNSRWPIENHDANVTWLPSRNKAFTYLLTHIVDTQQMLNHIVWPHGRDAHMLFENTKQRLPSYHGYPPGRPTDTILVFDRYMMTSQPMRIRRGGGEGSTYYNLTINSPLPCRDAILKNKHNKLELSCILSTLDMDAYMAIDSRYNGGFDHEEADVTMIAYLLQAAESGKSLNPIELSQIVVNIYESSAV